MSKSNYHVFIYKTDGSGVVPPARISHRIDGREITLPEMLEAFETYLKACGYSFYGHVGIVEEDDE